MIEEKYHLAAVDAITKLKMKAIETNTSSLTIDKDFRWTLRKLRDL